MKKLTRIFLSLLVFGVLTIIGFGHGKAFAKTTSPTSTVVSPYVVTAPPPGGSGSPSDVTSYFTNRMHTNANYMENNFTCTQFTWSQCSAADIYFYNKVKYGGAWDYKIIYGYNTKYLFHGHVITGDDFGNIHYGYVGTAIGFTAYDLKYAAGMAQVYHNYASYDVSKMDGYWDQPRDTQMIQYGINLYNQEHGGSTWVPIVF
jgi:hypothetical protein